MAFKEKVGGYFMITVEAKLLDPATGKVNWTSIFEKKGNLPTYN